jgi:hypothetical protein
VRRVFFASSIVVSAFACSEGVAPSTAPPTATTSAQGSGGAAAPLDAGVEAGPDATTAGAMSGGSGGAGGSAGSMSEAGVDAGPVVLAGCAQNDYPLCLDFEDNSIGAEWTGDGQGSIQSAQVAHGGYAYRGYGGPLLNTAALEAFTNVMWGRLYLYMSPGAPNGHGALVGVFDQAENWYELGYEFKGLLANWHGLGGERAIRSHPDIPGDAWVCVEFLFDGATPADAAIWMNGEPVEYYMPSDFDGPLPVTTFEHLFVGFSPYHGLSLTDYGGEEPPVLTEMFLDDVAFDTQRIGCISD